MTERKADRHTQAGKHADTEIYIQTYRQTGTGKQSHMDKTYKHTDNTVRHTQADSQTGRHTQTDRDTEQKDTGRQTHKDRGREPHTET